MNTVETLQAARDYIMEHGWIKGTLEHGGKVCAVGAVRRVCGLTETFEPLAKDHPAVLLLNQAAEGRGAEADHFNTWAITAYNDLMAESAGDVLSLYDDAILLAKEAEADVA